MKWTTKLALALAAMAAAVNAQVAIKGKHVPGAVAVAARAFNLPHQDNELLLAKEDASHGGYQFAHPVDVHITPAVNGGWTEVAGGRVWVLPIHSRGATSLSVIFNKFDIPEGAELYVYNGETTLGAFTRKNVKSHGMFSVRPVVGDSLTLELFVPTGAAEPTIEIGKISHGYKTLSFGSSGNCNINVVCPEAEGWETTVRAAGMLLTQFNSRYCSGSLVNTVGDTGRQLFLTANHCMGGSVASDQVMFNYQSPICPLEDQSDGPTTDTVSGLNLLASYAPSDFALLEIEEEIPSSYNVFLAGFNAVNETSTNIVGIHHPSGDIKKFTRAFKTVEYAYWSAAELPNRYHWEISSWDEGTTEPGSSGSPLFDSNQRIIGQLHGGAASCRNIDYDSYGAVWASWDQGTQRLQPYLDPTGTGVRVVDGIDLNRARLMKKAKLQDNQ